MFKKLKLKLTLINTAVVGLIFIFIFAGIYLLMIKTAPWQSERLMMRAASQIHPDRVHRIQGESMLRFNYFYAITDKSNDIIGSPANLPISQEQLVILVEKVLQSPEKKGIININEESYRFLNTTLDVKNNMIVFSNTGPENETGQRLLIILAVTGIISLALTFIASLYIAGRSLIPIKNSWQQQRYFIADASHELRTPLSVIQTNLEVVRCNPNETVKSQTKWLENIQAESRHMTKLIDSLLFLARADSKQNILEKSTFVINPVIKQVVHMFQPLASAKNIHLEFVSISPINFYGDETRIRQLITILTDNAIKYTPSGGKVEIDLKKQGNTIEIRVSDTGEGIAKENIDKIFQRFYTVDKARSRQNGGNGLGLSIAEWIVKEHGGTISVASTPGKGTTFQISFPKT